ncbi:MAG: DUF2079 domain-containing protein, partial [Dehalococcoidia bacterium]|nr:DUF2079 domain-containing protein [Dehalococcoidia bacterium]
VGWPVVAVSALWFVVAFFVVIRLNNPTGASPYLSRYDQYGSSPVEVVRTLVTDPGKALPEKSLPAKLTYLRQLFAPVAFLALLSPLALAPALPDLAINLLSSFEAMYSGGAHYSAGIVPFIIIASIDALAMLAALIARFAIRLAQPFIYAISGLVLLLSVWSYYQSVVLPLSDNFPVVTDHHRLLPEILALLPEDASVSASSTLNPQVSRRRHLYLFPDYAAADYVLVDVTASPYPMDDAAMHWRLTGLMNGGEWGWIAAKDGYLLLQRGVVNTPLPREFTSFARPSAPKIDTPILATFGEGLQFLGFSLSPGDTLHQKDGGARVRLFFKATQPQRKDYLVGVTAMANGERISQTFWFPTTLWYPMTKWQLDEVVMVEAPRVALAGQPWVDVYLSVHEPLERNQPGAKLPVRQNRPDPRRDAQPSDDDTLWLTRLKGEYW